MYLQTCKPVWRYFLLYLIFVNATSKICLFLVQITLVFVLPSCFCRHRIGKANIQGRN